MRRSVGWGAVLGAVGLVGACSSSPPSPSSPPAATWTGPAVTVAVSAPSSSGGWVTMAVAARSAASARPAPGTALATCVAELRASRLDAPDSETRLYADALASELDGQLAAARRSYYDLIVQAPGSPYIPMAYLAFGELFAAEAPGDPSKWELARQAYREVVKYPPARNLAFFYAHVRLAEASLRVGDAPAALDAGRRTLTGLDDRSPCGPLLRARALDLTVEAYATTGRPDHAPAFFRALLGPGADLDGPLVALGRRYLDDGRRIDACVLARASPPVEASLRPSCSP